MDIDYMMSDERLRDVISERDSEIAHLKRLLDASQKVAMTDLKRSDALKARAESAEAALAAAREENAAMIGAIDELCLRPSEPGVQFVAYVRDPCCDMVQTYALPPERVSGILEAIKSRSARMVTFGRQAVDALYTIDGLKSELATLRSRADDAGRVERVREPVRWFAEQMERKLAAHDDRDGWGNCKIGWLMKRLNEEMDEIREAYVEYQCSDPEFESDALKKVIDESADVANFAMMIADNARAVLAAADGTAGEGE